MLITIAPPLLAIFLGSAVSGSVPAPPDGMARIPVVLLTDAGSGQVLYARQPDLRFVPASVTKVMTAYVAFEAIKRGVLRPETPFVVSDAIAREWNGKGTSLYLRSGDRVTADTLIRGITTVSANDGAITLASGFAGSVPRWTELMNAAAGRLGMADSRFATPNGWPDNGATYVSARDLTKLGKALIEQHPDLYRRYFGQTVFSYNGVTQANRDPTLGVVAGADGIKTGHTNEAGYNFLGSAQRDGRRLLMVIAGAPSQTERTAASRALLEWGFAAWQRRPLFAAGATVGTARVQGGAARSVGLVTQRPIHADIPAEKAGPIRLRIMYSGPLVAPIAKGARVAELEIISGTAEPGRVPLLAGAAVAGAGPVDRIVNGVMGLAE